MNTITIHPDDLFAEALRSRAVELGKSINQTVQEMLAPALGLAKRHKKEENPFLSLCGVLPREGAEEQGAALSALRTVEPEMWK